MLLTDPGGGHAGKAEDGVGAGVFTVVSEVGNRLAGPADCDLSIPGAQGLPGVGFGQREGP